MIDKFGAWIKAKEFNHEMKFIIIKCLDMTIRNIMYLATGAVTLTDSDHIGEGSLGMSAGYLDYVYCTSWALDPEQ